jgi:hypothetical protein
MRTLEILEQSCTPPIGSLIDYDVCGNPIIGQCMVSPTQLDQVSQIQQGILDFHKLMSLHVRTIHHTENFKTLLRRILFRSVCRPSKEEVAIFQNWHHDENMVQQSTETLISSEIVSFISYMTPRQFLELPMSEIYWPYAVAITQSPQTASLLKAISSGILEAEEAESKIPGFSTLYFDIGQGFLEENSLSTELYKNLEGKTYVKFEWVGNHISKLCLQLINLPALVSINMISLTYWENFSNLTSRVMFSGSQIGTVLQIENMDRMGISTFQTESKPKIIFDFSTLKMSRLRRVRLEAAMSVMLLDIRPRET